MRALVVSDLHLTDRPDDEYRWQVFEQIREASISTGANELFILGDLTEFKDYHSSTLVNRIVDSLARLRTNGSRLSLVRILRGNHDGVDKDTPYFRFLNKIPWCEFHVEPTTIEVGKWTILMLPHTPDHKTDWKGLEFGAMTHIFLHGTVVGAAAETGHIMTSGIPVSLFKGLRGTRVIAGDIHVPQTVGGCVEYVGAPYPIRFGDAFKGRLLYLDGDDVESMPLDNIAKPALHFTPTRSDPGLKAVKKGDQVKVVIALAQSQLGQFHSIKQEAIAAVEKKGGKVGTVRLVKVSEEKMSSKPTLRSAGKRNPLAEFQNYCKRKGVAEAVQDLGEAILKDEV